MSVSISHCGPKICLVNDKQFTYITTDLTPQIALFLFEQYIKSEFDLNKTYELFTIVIKDEDKIYFDDAILHVMRYIKNEN